MDFEAILTEAHKAANEAIKAEIAVRPENERDFDCGFAWVIIDGNSALAAHCRAAIKKAGDGLPGTTRRDTVMKATRLYGSKGYPRGWQFWKPGDFNGQSVRIHEVGSKAFRDALANHGIRADFGSRLD